MEGLGRFGNVFNGIINNDWSGFLPAIPGIDTPIFDAGEAGGTLDFFQRLKTFNDTVEDCYNSSHQTAVGKATEFFSALSWLPVDKNYKENIKDTVTFGLFKASTITAAANFGKGIVRIIGKGGEAAATAAFAGATAVDSVVFSGCVGGGVNAASLPTKPI